MRQYDEHPNSPVSTITADGRVIACLDRGTWVLVTPDGEHATRFEGHEPRYPYAGKRLEVRG